MKKIRTYKKWIRVCGSYDNKLFHFIKEIPAKKTVVVPAPGQHPDFFNQVKLYLITKRVKKSLQNTRAKRKGR